MQKLINILDYNEQAIENKEFLLVKTHELFILNFFQGLINFKPQSHLKQVQVQVRLLVL
jgi:hypothetical protein